MYASVALAVPQDAVSELESELSVSRQIRRFLDGESDGGALFEALYGSIAEEPVPQRLLDVLRSR
jgi:hypothetical protein